MPFEHFDEHVTIDELNGWNAITSGLALGIESEGSCRDDQSFVCTSHHCTAEITNLGRSDGTLVTFTLEENIETDKGVDLQRTNAVDTAVARLACD